MAEAAVDTSFRIEKPARASVLAGEVYRGKKIARRFGFLFALLMLVTAVASTKAAFQAIRAVPVQAASDALQNTNEENQPNLAELLALLRKADRWYAFQPFTADDTANLAYLHMMVAIKQGTWNPTGKKHLQQAETYFRHSLKRSAANSVAWARLAHVLILRGKPPEQAVILWQKSIEAAPFEPKLLLWRGDFGLGNNAFLNEKQKAMTKAQIVNAWTLYPWGTSKLLAKHNLPKYLEDTWNDDEEGKKKFEKNYHYAREEWLQQRKATPLLRLKPPLDSPKKK
jgi:hypothetical protein